MNSETIINTYATLTPAALTLLAPITTDDAHEAALQVIDDLMERLEQNEHHPLRPLFELLVERVEAYENQQELPEATPSERLNYLLTTHHLNQTQLAQATGIPQSNISAVLRGAREISRGMAHKLAAHFNLPAAVFL